MDIKKNADQEMNLGKIMLETMKKYENDINQIEVVNDVIETHGSVRLRSIRVAQSLKAKGLKKGDVVLFGAVNHNDLCIPYIAAIYLGATPVGIAVEMKHDEIKHIVSVSNPSFVFADPYIVLSIQKILQEINNHATIVTFGHEKFEQFDNFSDYVKETGTEENFECENFDPKETTAVLACSSGTTGLPKLAKLSHYYLYDILVDKRILIKDDRKEAIFLNFSPIYWLSGIFSTLSTCLNGTTRIQSIKSFSPAIFDKASKVYNAAITIISQIIICSLKKYAESDNITFPSFKQIFIGGSAVSDDAYENMKKLVPNIPLIILYGSTETSLITLMHDYKKGSCGKVCFDLKWKVVDVNTGKKLGPNREGELYVKSSTLFLGYYNNPEATKESFDGEGYFKTGDLVYYDEDGYFFIVDRIKQLIKYRNYHVSSIELENLINDIPGIFLSAVVGIPHPEDGEHPMAFVQMETGATVHKETILDLVKEKLSDPKQLRGGVVFVDSIPTTYTGKIDRKELRQLKMKFIKQ